MFLPVGPSGALPPWEGVQECGRPVMGIPCRGGGVGGHIKAAVGRSRTGRWWCTFPVFCLAPPLNLAVFPRPGVPQYRPAIAQACSGPRPMGFELPQYQEWRPFLIPWIALRNSLGAHPPARWGLSPHQWGLSPHLGRKVLSTWIARWKGSPCGKKNVYVYVETDINGS